MRESRLSGSVEGVMSDHDSYSDFRNFRPVRESYAVRERSSSDKERQGAGNAGCRTMSRRFVLDELKGKDLQGGRWRSRVAWAPTAAGATHAVPKGQKVERGGRDAIRGSGQAGATALRKPCGERRKRYFTSQVSPARRSLARSPGPRLAMTAWTCSFMTSS